MLEQKQWTWRKINLCREVGIAQWLEHQTRDWMVTGLSPGRRIFFSMVNFLCWLIFQYCSTSTAWKRAWSFCQKCRWQVTAKHTCTLCMWLCMKWHDTVHACIVYTECAETAAVSRGTSHVTTKQHCKYTNLVDIYSKMCNEKLVTHTESHVTTAQWVCLSVENSAI